MRVLSQLADESDSIEFIDCIHQSFLGIFHLVIVDPGLPFIKLRRENVAEYANSTF